MKPSSSAPKGSRFEDCASTCSERPKYCFCAAATAGVTAISRYFLGIRSSARPSPVQTRWYSSPREIAAHAGQSRRSGDRVFSDQRPAASFPGFRGPEHGGTAARGALDDISHAIVEGVRRVIELGQLRGPRRSGSNKRDFALSPWRLPFSAKASALETRAAASSVADCGSAMTIIAVFMTLID